MKKRTLEESFEERPYQTLWKEHLITFTKKWLREELMNPKKIDLWSSMPIHMATWSWKTYTVWSYLDYVYNARNKLEALSKKNIPINLLMINDRINLVNQFKKDLLVWRDWKKALLATSITKYAKVKVFHTWNKDNTFYAWNSSKQKDSFYFSTFWSIDKVIDEEIFFDIIIIDEAHHLAWITYMESLKKIVFSYQRKKWRMPLIIPMSATMDPIRDLINEPVVDFWLAKYIASKFSPDITYTLVSSSWFSPDEFQKLYDRIEKAKTITDTKEKRKEIRDIKEFIQEHLAKFTSLENLCKDFIERVDSLDHTVIYANTIEEVNMITKEMNIITWDENTAVAFHSRIDLLDEKVLSDYNSGEKKVIVAVWKLNEWIDMPKTKNIVFRRNSESFTLFKQQFWRWLRWDKIHNFDYTWRLSNMNRIAWINREINTLTGVDGETKNDTLWNNNINKKWITMLIWDVFNDVKSQDISIDTIIKSFEKLEFTSILKEINSDWRIVLEWKTYQWVWNNTPKEQLRWLFWYNILMNKVKKQSDEWKEKNIRYAKKSWFIVTIVEINALIVLLEKEISFSKLNYMWIWFIWSKQYQWVWSNTPKTSLSWLSWEKLLRRINNKSNEWKKEYKAEGLYNWKLVTIIDSKELSVLINEELHIPTLWEKGTCEIEWSTYQWVWAQTPEYMLFGINWRKVERIVLSQDDSWKEENIATAQWKKWTIRVVKKTALFDVLKEKKVPIIADDWSCQIRWIEYQYVPNKWKMRWISSVIIHRKIALQTNSWKKKNSRFWTRKILKSWVNQKITVKIVKTKELKKILKKYLDRPILWKNGKYLKDWVLYQYIWLNTPCDQLEWFDPQKIYKRVIRKDKEWKKRYTLQATLDEKTVLIVSTEELRKFFY